MLREWASNFQLIGVKHDPKNVGKHKLKGQMEFSVQAKCGSGKMLTDTSKTHTYIL